ncbi:glycosyltransferase family 39 protein [Dokdonella sp.]|uniref:glycosyltransferase family 39 protein n=1 Tax=Dokdonella sp. TaxID=2291710 RepID=UPI001B23D9B4|nr:glycosyltransferase family 39 protein [Dokdonella sp.]MBO9661729.1 glycosyltransferase family 39 protein [Dokdonella sp.]
MPPTSSLAIPAATRRAWLLVVCVLLYACVLQGMRPLYSPDEGRYTNVALGMLDSGDWMRPMLHPEVEHWSKPPLTYWSIATSFVVFGRSEFAARLPGTLAFGCTILLLGRLGRRFVPEQPWLPALVYASFVFPSLAANLVTTDSLLALWETLQVVVFVELWHAATPQAARRARLLLGLAAGLAFMTKGPPGLLALGACLVFAFWSERWRGLWRAFGWDALLVFLVVGGTWYAVIAWREPAVLRYFLVEEVVNRVASDKMHRNAEWYGALKVYLPTLLVGSLPWLPVLVGGAWKHRHGVLARLRADDQRKLLACWLLLPLAVFVVARSRLPLYVLPLFAPLAVLTARMLVPLNLRSRGVLALVCAWCAALVLARAVPAWLDVDGDDRRLAAEIRAQLAPVPDEVAFVDTAPRFGLRFYLGSKIERLDLPGESPTPQAEDLSTEVTESEGCRLLVVREEQRDALERALLAHQIEWWRLRDARGYALLAEIAEDCAWKAQPDGRMTENAHP